MSATLLRLTALSWACAIRSADAFHLNHGRRMALTTTTASQRIRNYATTTTDSEDAASSSKQDDNLLLCNKAKDFINYKNAAGSGASTLDPVFDMCSPDVDLYGLKGGQVRPGFIAFFEGHEGLHHELMEEPTVVAPDIVQYPFIKTWKSDETGEMQRWSSIDPNKPRNKVERLQFDENGQLARVSVVEANEPCD